MDALLALPLARFRKAIAELGPDELAALEARLAVQRISTRWARGGYGIARHRVANELGLLARREAAVGRERDARLTAAPAPLRLITPGGHGHEPIAPAAEAQAA